MNQADARSGMMLAAVPPSRMMPWTRARRLELLAPQPDRGEQQDQRVERVPAAPRIRRRVRLEAGEDDLDVLRRERVALDVAAVARVVQEGGVEAVEQPVIDHDLLAAPPLLGRRAEEDDLAGQLVGDRREGDGGADAGGGHRVVAAAVAQPGQGVVLGEDPDARPVAAPAAAPRRPDGGRQAAGRMLDLEAMAGQDLGDPGRGVDAPRTRAPGRRGSGATGRGSRRARPRRRRRDGPSRPRTARPGGWRSAAASGLLGLADVGWVGAQPSAGGRAPARHRSADRVASATTTSAIMNSAIGSSSRPWSRSTTRTAATIPTHDAAPDRPQPVAAIGDLAVAAVDGQPDERDQRQRDREADEERADEPGAPVDERIARRDDEPDEHPDDRGRGEEAEVGRSVAGFHDHRV